MRQIEEAIGTADIMPDKLLQWKISLNEKLMKICTLDDEILVLIDNEAIDNVIEQADVYCSKWSVVLNSWFCMYPVYSVLVVRYHLTVELQQ